MCVAQNVRLQTWQETYDEAGYTRTTCQPRRDTRLNQQQGQGRQELSERWGQDTFGLGPSFRLLPPPEFVLKAIKGACEEAKAAPLSWPTALCLVARIRPGAPCAFVGKIMSAASVHSHSENRSFKGSQRAASVMQYGARSSVSA